MALLLAAIAVLAVFALAMMVRSLPQSAGQQIQKQNYPSTQNTAANPEEAKYNKQKPDEGAQIQEPQNYWERFFRFIETREKLITAFSAILMVVITGVVALSTYFLYSSTRDLVSGADDTAKRQLRAYVAVFPSRLDNIRPNEVLGFITGNINGGQTPAYQATTKGIMLLLKPPLPDNFPFPDIPLISSDRNSKTTFPPRLTFNGNIMRDEGYSKEELIEILKAGKQKLFFFGQVDYVDAFNKPRWTRFCFSFPGWKEAVPLAEADKWDEIQTISRQFGFNFTFEVCSQHNITDEG